MSSCFGLITSRHHVFRIDNTKASKLLQRRQTLQPLTIQPQTTPALQHLPPKDNLPGFAKQCFNRSSFAASLRRQVQMAIVRCRPKYSHECSELFSQAMAHMKCNASLSSHTRLAVYTVKNEDSSAED